MVLTFHACIVSKSPPLGISSSPKITDPNTMARFLGSILFLSECEATRARCSTNAFRVAWWIGGNRRIFERRTAKLFAMCSSTLTGKSRYQDRVYSNSAHLYPQCVVSDPEVEI